MVMMGREATMSHQSLGNLGLMQRFRLVYGIVISGTLWIFNSAMWRIDGGCKPCLVFTDGGWTWNHADTDQFSPEKQQDCLLDDYEIKESWN
jgi:hypothetical protein